MPRAWSIASPHLSPAYALCSSNTEHLATPQTHHASSGLSTYAQAVPSDGTRSLPILHPTPIHPSKPQSGISMKTAVFPTPTPNSAGSPRLPPCPHFWGGYRRGGLEPDSLGSNLALLSPSSTVGQVTEPCCAATTGVGQCEDWMTECL